MDILAFILSNLATVCVCIPPLLKGKNMKLILLLVFTTNALLATSYILTGASNGAASCCIGAVQCLINYAFFERKNREIPRWLIGIYGAAFLVVNLLVFTQLVDILAILAAMAFILSICQKNGKMYRLWTLINTVLWLVYDFITHSYGPLSTHAILLASLLFGMVMHDRKKK